MGRKSWKLTVRHGSRVSRAEFGSLDEAIGEAGRRSGQIRAEGPLKPVKAFRDYEPGDRIHARLEIAAPGLWRPATAGIDLMGDGSEIPYLGGVKRRELEVDAGASPLEAVARALSEVG